MNPIRQRQLASGHRMGQLVVPDFAYDLWTDYADGLSLFGLSGGVDGEAITWFTSYLTIPLQPAGFWAYDLWTDYADGVGVDGLNGGVNVNGSWDGAYKGI